MAFEKIIIKSDPYTFIAQKTEIFTFILCCVQNCSQYKEIRTMNKHISAAHSPISDDQLKNLHSFCTRKTANRNKWHKNNLYRKKEKKTIIHIREKRRRDALAKNPNVEKILEERLKKMADDRKYPPTLDQKKIHTLEKQLTKVKEKNKSLSKKYTKLDNFNNKVIENYQSLSDMYKKLKNENDDVNEQFVILSKKAICHNKKQMEEIEFSLHPICAVGEIKSGIAPIKSEHKNLEHSQTSHKHKQVKIHRK